MGVLFVPDLVTPPRLLLRWGGAIVLLRLIARLIVSVWVHVSQR